MAYLINPPNSGDDAAVAILIHSEELLNLVKTTKLTKLRGSKVGEPPNGLPSQMKTCPTACGPIPGRLILTNTCLGKYVT